MTETPTLPMPITTLTKAQKTQVLNLVRRAAKAEILPRFRKADTLNIQAKSNPLDLVTEADTSAEAMITRGLQRAFPHALIVGEEGTAANPSLRDHIPEAELCFLIDPVDGTWNFANGLMTFGTILAACRFGQPVFGLIYDPLADDVVMADLESPAQFVPAHGAPRQLRTAAAKPLSEMVGLVHFKLFADALQPAVAAVYPRLGKPASLNCSAHEYRTLAQGGVDFILSPSQTPWDHAAGVLITQKAGGHVAMLDGADYSASLREGNLLAACSKETWDIVAEAFDFLLTS